MATTTPNYELIKPDNSDFVKVSDLNTNFDIIDAALAEIAAKSGGGNKPVSAALVAEAPAVRSIAAWATLDGWTYVQDSNNDAKTTSTQSLYIGRDCYLVAAAMYRGSDITLAQEGWTKIADSQVTAELAQKIAVWGRAATAGTYTVTVTQPSSVRMGLKLFALAGASDISVVDNVLISAFPFTAPATTGKRRLYLASSAYATGNSISVRTADSSLQSAEEQRYSAFYDSRTVSGIESVFTTPMSDYTANTANIITLDIEEV